jgi:DNA-binding transcriptional MerR regulator
MPERLLRIGELSRHAGVSVEVLRAWERRYGLLEPARTPGGFRLYSERDVERVQAMCRSVRSGLSPAEAARLVLEEEQARPPSGAGTALDGARLELDRALSRFDEVGAQAVLDRLLTTLSLEVVLQQAVLPYLRELGERWERGEASIALEHFASNIIRGRLASLARGWDRGGGNRALLACVAGEHHDLPLLMLGLGLRAHGWRISYLGTDTPGSSLVAAATELAPDAVVVSGSAERVFWPELASLRTLADQALLHIAGAGATAALARVIGASHLAGDPIQAAGLVARHSLGHGAARASRPTRTAVA